jgi:hypothetical protein
MTSSAFLLFHVVISLAAILAGFVVVRGFFTGRGLAGWNAFFLVTTIATSVTGFLFPFHGFTPAHYVGILSLIILAIALLARYRSWRRVYVITALIALYLNMFVLVVQTFLKVPALHALAPKGAEPPFAIAQTTVLLVFIALGVFATKQRYSMPISST